MLTPKKEIVPADAAHVDTSHAPLEYEAFEETTSSHLAHEDEEKQNVVRLVEEEGSEREEPSDVGVKIEEENVSENNVEMDGDPLEYETDGDGSDEDDHAEETQDESPPRVSFESRPERRKPATRNTSSK